jgi:hypothetical protein
MTLRFECSNRNYELEGIKYKLRGKRITARENPLASGLGDIVKDEDSDDENQKETDGEKTSITHKLGVHDPLSDYQ